MIATLNQPDENAETDLPLDANFVEQAEYIEESTFEALSATHPAEESIVRRLSVGGAKLLVGPRGCGKTTLMLKAFYGLLRDNETNTLPVYVNFKISLKLEPLYINTPNATFWFRLWLNLKIYEGIYDAVEQSGRYEIPAGIPSRSEINSLLSSIEEGQVNATTADDMYSMSGLSQNVSRVLAKNRLIRCVLLLDDAAHAFSPRQQEDFFEFFRQIKSREISPKAAIYPGITTHSPTFHVGHDAEQIDVWVRPDTAAYIDFMRSLAAKRFNGELPRTFLSIPDSLDFLAYQKVLLSLKEFNQRRDDDNQALEIGLKRQVPADLEKVFSFYQYAGLMMPVVDNSRGVKGVFDLYMVHFGDLVTDNAIIGRRTKSVSSFVKAFTAQTHQAWPRISPDTLVAPAQASLNRSGLIGGCFV
jgi:hypothetical protein